MVTTARDDNGKRSLSISALNYESGHFDLTGFIDRVIDHLGPFQILLFILLCTNSIIIGINHTVTSFHIYTPEYSCSNENQNGDVSSTEITKVVGCRDNCTIYDFSGEYTSVVTEWMLICSERYKSALVNTLYFCGVTLGSLVCGALADLWGRRKLVLICLYGQGLLGASLYLTQELYQFMFLRIMQGFFIQGLQGCSYTLLLEFCPPKRRTFAGVMWECFWGIGLIILGCVAYFIHDWRTLQLALTIPTIITLAYTWLIPESPRWLLTKNHRQEAFQTTANIAKRNKDREVWDEYGGIRMETHGQAMTMETNPLKGEHGVDEEDEPQSGIMDIFRNPILGKHAFIMIVVFYAVTLSYYGILLFLENLPGDRHTNFVLGAIIEIASYIVAFFILSRFGRRIPMVFYQYINGIFCLLIGLLSIVKLDFWGKDQLIIFFALFGKGLTVSGFCGMFIYSSELFPTSCRSSALGLCGFWARVGSLTAPLVKLMSEYTNPMLPMSLIAGGLFVSGTLTFRVPETLNKKLPNNLKEVNLMWGKNVLDD